MKYTKEACRRYLSYKYKTAHVILKLAYLLVTVSDAAANNGVFDLLFLKKCLYI